MILETVGWTYSSRSTPWHCHLLLYVKRKIVAPGGLLYIFWVRGRAIGKGINFHDFGIRNSIDFHDFGIRNGIDFCNWYRVGYAFSENWYKVRYIF